MVEDQKKTVGKSFFSGVLLLTTSTVLVKLIGLFYKIPMLAYLGSEGMGYFNSAYEIYALFCVIATAGLPVAVSVLISGAIATGNGWRVRKIYRAWRLGNLDHGSICAPALSMDQKRKRLQLYSFHCANRVFRLRFFRNTRLFSRVSAHAAHGTFSIDRVCRKAGIWLASRAMGIAKGL